MTYVPEGFAQMAHPEVSTFDADHYDFQFLSRETLDGVNCFVFDLSPKARYRELQGLFEGRIWVDAEDFAVVRAEGKPAKNPSFWTHSVNFVQVYHKSGTFWFPLSTESVTDARFFGKTAVSIRYFDYQPNSAVEPVISQKTGWGQIEANYAHE